jgi:alpha-glucosidase
VVCITDLHIAEAPGEGYAPFDSGDAGDHFVRKADGTAFAGEVWPGQSRFPDYTRAETRPGGAGCTRPSWRQASPASGTT